MITVMNNCQEHTSHDFSNELLHIHQSPPRTAAPDRRGCLHADLSYGLVLCQPLARKAVFPSSQRIPGGHCSFLSRPVFRRSLLRGSALWGGHSSRDLYGHHRKPVAFPGSTGRRILHRPFRRVCDGHHYGHLLCRSMDDVLSRHCSGLDSLTGSLSSAICVGRTGLLRALRSARGGSLRHCGPDQAPAEVARCLWSDHCNRGGTELAEPALVKSTSPDSTHPFSGIYLAHCRGYHPA